MAYCGDCGSTVEIGDRCCGYDVGYVGEDGLAWQSRRERDVAVGAGRCADAFAR